MNKEQIIDEVYENYKKDQNGIIGSDLTYRLSTPSGYDFFRLYTKEEFINKCKTDPEFSERWGLKIEERKLSLEERIDYWLSKDDFRFTGAIINEEDYESFGFPTKLITLTYNDETIDVYDNR